MWLLYLRFDDGGHVVTMHVRCDRRNIADEILGLAQHHGLTPTATLVEYARYRSGLAIRPEIVPLLHHYSADQFRQQWHAAAESI